MTSISRSSHSLSLSLSSNSPSLSSKSLQPPSQISQQPQTQPPAKNVGTAVAGATAGRAPPTATASSSKSGGGLIDEEEDDHVELEEEEQEEEKEEEVEEGEEQGGDEDEYEEVEVEVEEEEEEQQPNGAEHQEEEEEAAAAEDEPAPSNADPVEEEEEEAVEEETAAEETGPEEPIKASPTFNLTDHLTSRTHCPLCSSLYDLEGHLPILLHAGHNFCSSCMVSSPLLAQVGSSVTCPACKVVVEVPDDAGSRIVSLETLMTRVRKRSHAPDITPSTSLAPLAAHLSGPLTPFPVNFLIKDRLEVEEFRKKVGDKVLDCERCDDKASGICLVCEHFLCDFHQDDHQRSKDTKAHAVQSLDEYITSDPPPAAASSRSFCTSHPDTELDLFCLECQVPICVRCSLPSGGTIHCTSATQQHPTEGLKLSSRRQFHELSNLNEQSKQKYMAVVKGMSEIQKVVNKIHSREEKVTKQINDYFDTLHAMVDERKKVLITKLTELVSTKNYTLDVQNQILNILAKTIEQATLEVDEMLVAVGGISINPKSSTTNSTTSQTSPPAHDPLAPQSIEDLSSLTVRPANRISASSKLLHIQQHLSANLESLIKFQPVALHPEDSEQFSFYVGSGAPRDKPDEVGTDDKLLTHIAKVGTLGDSMAIASLCTASGEGLTSTFVRLESRFQIQARDRFGQLKTKGGDPFFVEFIGPKGSATGRLVDHQNGTYTVRYMVLSPGSYSVVVSIHGRHISGSPFRISVHGAKDGSSLGREYLGAIGSRGSNPNQGQFMNPMGMTVTKEGVLVIADYGNNRLSLFQVGNGFPFLRTIGKSGTDTASLKNPWSVAYDPCANHIYVTDCGNHRIQVFHAVTGDWVKSFGSVGGAPGKFRHPAGIAIYTPVGAKPEHSSDHSSASIPELQQQLLFISDREKHRIQVFDMNGRFLRAFGSSGAGPTQFLHPSGVAIDPRLEIKANDAPHLPGTIAPTVSGPRVYVCDFSNHRIQVFHLSGQFITMWGSRGSLPGQFLDPVGINIDRDGLVYVADQGNHRVQIFSPSGTFLRLLGHSGTSQHTKPEKGQFSKPTALCIVSLRNDGSTLQINESDTTEQPTTNGVSSSHSTMNGVDSAVPTKSCVTNTLVFVSDAANHRLQVFK